MHNRLNEADPRLTIIVDGASSLTLLDQQTIGDAELIAVGNAVDLPEVVPVAESRGWSLRWADTDEEALVMARGEFVVGWFDVTGATPDTLVSLVAAAAGDPNKRGSLTANFDPLVLLRTEEFVSGATGRRGLAQADVKAVDRGNRAFPHPSGSTA